MHCRVIGVARHMRTRDAKVPQQPQGVGELLLDREGCRGPGTAAIAAALIGAQTIAAGEAETPRWLAAVHA